MDNETPNYTQNQHDKPTTEPAVSQPETKTAPDNTGAVLQSDQASVEHTPSMSVHHNNNKPYKPWYKRPLVLAIIIIVLLGAAAGYWYMTKKSTPVNKSATSVSSSTKADSLNSLPPAGAAKLLATPTKIDPLTLFTDLSVPFGTDCTGATSAQISTGTCPAIKLSAINFYKIGATSDGSPIYVLTGTSDGPFDSTYVVVQDSANHYTIYGRYSYIDTNPAVNTDKTSLMNAQTQAASLKKSLATNVSLDTTNLIPGLSFPDNPTISGLKVSLGTYVDATAGRFINGLTNIRSLGGPVAETDLKKLSSQKGVDFYEVTISKKGTFQLREIDGTLGGVFAVQYQLNNSLLSTTAPAITWTDGTKNLKTYTSRTPGCGSAYGYLVATTIDPKTLVLAGTTSDGQKLYQLPDSDPFLTDVYTQDYDKGTNLDDKSLQNMSIADFQKGHSLLVAKNALGDYQAYLRNDLFTGGGCAKPVIYLYPTTPVSVSVRVAARVTKSNPVYDPSFGWQNVAAQPNGQLSYRGTTYDSLFWEGLGLGIYPDITGGTVVKQAEAVATIKSQLTAQGLQAHEISDFLDYWQPKLPKTAYVRLSWLTTDQLNTLAPLSIQPAPQTLIRTFLDFKGLGSPVKIPAQHFSAPTRKGFTVVEWGGLLQTN